MNHFKKNTRLKKWNSRGQSLVELGIALPLFLGILFGIVELSNMLMMSLRVSNLSREIANVTFRDCTFLNDTAIASCLSSDVTRISNEGNRILKNFNSLGIVIASTYAKNTPDSPFIRLVNQKTAGGGKYTSHYNVNNVDSAVINTHDRIVIGEVIYPYVPITPVKGFLTLFNLRTVIYEVTIY